MKSAVKAYYSIRSSTNEVFAEMALSQCKSPLLCIISFCNKSCRIALQFPVDSELKCHASFHKHRKAEAKQDIIVKTYLT